MSAGRAAHRDAPETKEEFGVFCMWAKDEVEHAPNLAYLAEWDHLNAGVIEKLATMSTLTHLKLRVMIDQRMKQLTAEQKDVDLLANLGV